MSRVWLGRYLALLTKPTAWRRVGCTYSISRRSFVLVEEPAEEVASLDRGGNLDGIAPRPGCVDRVGRSQAERAMGTMLVEVTHVDAQDVHELSAAEDEDTVEALAPDAADPALEVGGRGRRLEGRVDHADPVPGEDRVEGAGELLVAVVDRVIRSFE
jgi:hypothetical protein